MTLTLELPAEIESRLAQRAAVEGVTVEVAALEALSEATLSEDELDALLDERDAERMRNRVPADPADCYSLDDLRKAIRRCVNARPTARASRRARGSKS